MTSRHPPDPRRGVFETLLVVAGKPVELDSHLARLRRSLEDLYRAELPSGAREEARAAAAAEELGRLRLTATPAQPTRPPGPDATVELRIEATPVDPDLIFALERGALLETTDLPGGLGPNKWADRSGLNPLPDGSGPLIADGAELLEAGWANLFAVRGGIVRTPPADGRILPGLARAAILELAPDLGYAAREEPLRRDDLLDAEEVFLTNSIRGVEGARSLDGDPLAGTGSVSRRLAAALARRWRLPAGPGVHPTPAAAPIPGLPAR
jgi:para-aminobenzoate synthetase/4-amino-4-deoxychorismate lyase